MNYPPQIAAWAKNMLKRAGYIEPENTANAVDAVRSESEVQRRIEFNQQSIREDYQRRHAEAQARKVTLVKAATAEDILGPTHKLEGGRLVHKKKVNLNIRLPLADLDLDLFPTEQDLVDYLEKQGLSADYWKEPTRSLALHRAMVFPVDNIQMPGANPQHERSTIDDDIIINRYANF